MQGRASGKRYGPEDASYALLDACMCVNACVCVCVFLFE
jgi:hypothetical protein